MSAFYEESMGDMDIIFAGGGTAACVTAGRLAKANPDLKILLIEGGPNNHNNPSITTPAAFLSHLAPDSKHALFYKSKTSPYLNNRKPVVPMGGVLGGGSSINFMMYTRAQGIDYDSWNTPGWTSKEMIPLCRKLETFHPKGQGHDMSVHGTYGPINISDGGYRGKSENQFLETIKQMGYNNFVEVNNFEDNHGFAKFYRYVSPDGKRQDAAHRYIHPLLEDGQHPNLHILVESKVVHVIFDESSPPRAIGVEYMPNEEHQPMTSLSKPIHKIIKANKLVVITAGTLGTPQILERSGVGNAEIIKKLNIPVISDVPGVGENYQDHHLLLYPYKTSLDPSETLDGVFSGRKELVKALEQKDPILGWNAIDFAAKLRMTPDEVTSLGPEFAKDYNRDFEPYPSRPIMITGIINAFLADQSLVEPGQYVTFPTFTAYPYSRGSIHITSATDCINGYDFDTGFLNHPSDIKKQLWAYKMSRELARRLPFITDELSLGHPKFSPSSSACLFSPGKQGEISNLTYSEEDDAIIEDWIRDNLNTTWHSLGTCAMRPKEEGGVVDADLNVYGTSGLKVGDLSMVPENVGANTNNTALVVGEKVAVIIGRELGIEV